MSKKDNSMVLFKKFKLWMRLHGYSIEGYVNATEDLQFCSYCIHCRLKAPGCDIVEKRRLWATMEKAYRDFKDSDAPGRCPGRCIEFIKHV